jgi:hypothetical protein
MFDEAELALREFIETEIRAHETDADQRIVIADGCQNPRKSGP